MTADHYDVVPYLKQYIILRGGRRSHQSLLADSTTQTYKMFKLVVLSALLAAVCAAPAPGLLAAAPVAYTAVVGHAPATISHTSSAVVHSAALAAPVVAAAPAVVSYAAPAVVAAAPAPAVLSAYSVHPAPAPLVHSVW